LAKKYISSGYSKRNFTERHDAEKRLYYSTVSRISKYAYATDSFDKNLTLSARYGYASAKDLSLMRK